MLKIVALNDGEEGAYDDEDTGVTREAQETIAESEYIRAIKLKSDGDTDLCLHLLKELLRTQVINESTENSRNFKLWTIKYNCHKNIASILEERCEYILALQHYISAILIDSTDVSTLYRFGQLALKLHATDLAEYAFESCLSRNSAHWCATEGILQVMNANSNIMGSYNCAKRIYQENVNSESAVQTLSEITNLFKQNLPYLKRCSGSDMTLLSNEHSTKHFKYLLNGDNVSEKATENCLAQIPDLKKFCIKEANWESIGQFIVGVYNFLSEINHDMLFTFNINDFIENKNAVLSDIEKDLSDTTSINMDKTQLAAQKPDNIFKSDEDIIEQTKISTADIQSMDYNNYDSDSNLKSDGLEANKAKPRRRCSDLHFLEQWGWHKNRRYSSRKKTERDEVDNSLNGYLQKIFMKYTKIPIEDKWPFSNISGTDNNTSTDCYECKMSLSEDSFDLSTRTEFTNFTNKLKEKLIDLMELSYKWLKYISLGWRLMLPERLKTLYIDVFKIYVSHFTFSTWNQLTPTTFEVVYRICILYLELSARHHINDNSDIWYNVFHQLLFNIGNCHIISASDFEIYQLKLIYLEYLMLNKEHRYEDCLSCLKQMHDILKQQDSSYKLHIANLDNVCVNINYVQDLQLKYKRQIDVNNIPKFYEEGSWKRLRNIIIVNIEASEDKYDNECWLKDFCAQIEILLQSFWIMSSLDDCLIWSEKCLHFAVSHYLQESKTSNRCTLLAQSINFITSYIEAIIINEGFHFVAALKKENICRMVQNIIRILVYLFDGTLDRNSSHGRELNFKRLWVILHQLILREENDSSSIHYTTSNEPQDANELIPKSFLILFTAHEYLGKRQWCTDNNGEFLLYVLDAVVLNLKAPVYDVCRDIIYQYLEQVTYCLFKYPQKKARLRHLEDHEACQIQLNWPNAIQVFDLYRPEDLPEFNSYKLESITSDMEQLLLKIISLMPNELDPTKSIDHVAMFIEGRIESPPKDLNSFKLPYKILSLYYLLADFYFKNRDFVKAIKFYTLDLTVNPTRFDSWAGMALSKASKIETKLNGIDPISMEGIWDECEEVLRCFECSINLNRFQTLLWIEYGSFSYTIHSCFSRHVKCNSEKLSTETLSIINERKSKMLTIAFNCFSLANSLQNSTKVASSEDNSDSSDEMWLCQYMLGKISEKRKEEPKVYLSHYLMAANYLYENSATYPIKINHSNPTMLSVEALEVFYRINAVIIKYIQNKNEVSRSIGELFNKVLKSLSSSPFAYNKAKIDGNSLNILKGKHANKIKPPNNYIVKKENQNNATENKITANESLKNCDNEELEENMENEKNLKPPTKDIFHSSTSAVVASSASTSVISSDNSTVESESESDDSITDNEINNTHNEGDVLTVEELKLVYRMVVQNIEECVTRFPEHYKSIYRLIVHYMNSSADYCNLGLSEQLLLGQYKTSLGNLVNGLFYDRKNNNLFNGIWRIPSSEIDRPGSFSAHLVKCVKIFIKLLFATKNYSVLVDLAMNLYRTPDFDKRYITDAERKELCQQSINYTIEILRSIFQKNVDDYNDQEVLNILIDIYKTYKKCVKYMNQKESMIEELLVDVYKLFVKDKVEYLPDNCNFLELAIKLCVQEITAQKNLQKGGSHTDSTANVSDCIVTQSSEISNAIASRVIHIPGLSAKSKFRGSTFKPSAAAASNFSLQNTLNLLPTDLTKTPQILSTLGRNVGQVLERDAPELEKFFEEFYSKMLSNRVNICSATPLFSEKPINYVESQKASADVANALNMLLPYTPATPSTAEIASFAHSSNVVESSDSLLHNQLNPSILKQHLKTKSSYKNKPVSKPYNRPVQCEDNQNQNATNDAACNNKLDVLSNLSRYTGLLHNPNLPQIDYGNKHLVAAAKQSKNIKDYYNEGDSFKSILPMDSSSRFLPRTQIRNQLSEQPSTTPPTVISPTKTLQEKLAERQKAYQLNETNAASISVNATDQSHDDVIILD